VTGYSGAVLGYPWRRRLGHSAPVDVASVRVLPPGTGKKLTKPHKTELPLGVASPWSIRHPACVPADDITPAANGERYREMIDWLVKDCHELQGQVAPRKIRDGVWNHNATADFVPEEHGVNELLTALDADERAVVAWIAEQSFVAGVHQALVALHDFEVAPFDKGIEGTPFHDFMGRLHGSQWPA
jgi:hypothetical protein